MKRVGLYVQISDETDEYLEDLYQELNKDCKFKVKKYELVEYALSSLFRKDYEKILKLFEKKC